MLDIAGSIQLSRAVVNYIFKNEQSLHTGWFVNTRRVGGIFRKDDSKTSKRSESKWFILINSLDAYLTKWKSIWLPDSKYIVGSTKFRTHQCRYHGPGLSVVKRIVTLSVVSPMETTSRRTGFAKLNVLLPAERTTLKECYTSIQYKN